VLAFKLLNYASEDTWLGRVFLIRHGQVEWNAKNSYIGSTDLPLDHIGFKQADLLAQYLATREIAKVYSSDLLRARQTADVIATGLEIPLVLCRELRELSYGAWEGVSESEVARLYPDHYSRWLVEPFCVQIPEGEHLSEFQNRVLPAFQHIATENREDDIVIVAHKTANRLILAYLLGMDLNRYRQIGQNNACVNTVFVREDGSMSVETINDTCHLMSSCSQKTV